MHSDDASKAVVVGCKMQQWYVFNGLISEGFVAKGFVAMGMVAMGMVAKGWLREGEGAATTHHTILVPIQSTNRRALFRPNTFSGVCDAISVVTEFMVRWLGRLPASSLQCCVAPSV
jgi:hypothetical protein